MSDSIVDRLKMPHLAELHEDTQSAHRAATSPEPETNSFDESDARANERYTFSFSHKNKRGKLFEGQFTNKILTIGEKMSAGVTRARLQMGVPFDSLSVDTYNLLFATTWLQQSLVDKPAWAADLLALNSEELVGLIYAKVDDHERYFRGDSAADSQSETKVRE